MEIIMRERARRCSVSCELLNGGSWRDIPEQQYNQHHQHQHHQQQHCQLLLEDKDPEFRRRKRSGTWPWVVVKLLYTCILLSRVWITWAWMCAAGRDSLSAYNIFRKSLAQTPTSSFFLNLEFFSFYSWESFSPCPQSSRCRCFQG